MIQPDTFTNRNIGTCAALLSTGRVTFAGTSADPFSDKKIIHLEPHDVAAKLYRELINGTLLINARENGLWVTKLKELIFQDINGDNTYGRNT